MSVAAALPMVVTEVTAVDVDRLSPSFVRVELASPALADFGVDSPLLDQRIKLIFPAGPSGLPPFEDLDESWLSGWLDRPVHERGHMRTYSVREVRGSGTATTVVVDIVLHGDGSSGPGGRWAAAARPGDRLGLVGPRRGVPFGGIEFAPPDAASRLLLVADETAVPAACRILADLGPEAQGAAFLEVPVALDIQPVHAPRGVDVVWLPREAAPRGARQVVAVRRHLGLAPSPHLVDEGAVDPDLWETPAYSSSGEPLPDRQVPESALPGLYAWIAGESKVVTTLRRALVTELGLDRTQVAFMGYWREGVAMRS